MQFKNVLEYVCAWSTFVGVTLPSWELLWSLAVSAVAPTSPAAYRCCFVSCTQQATYSVWANLLNPQTLTRKHTHTYTVQQHITVTPWMHTYMHSCLMHIYHTAAQSPTTTNPCTVRMPKFEINLLTVQSTHFSQLAQLQVNHHIQQIKRLHNLLLKPQPLIPGVRQHKSPEEGSGGVTQQPTGCQWCVCLREHVCRSNTVLTALELVVL